MALQVERVILNRATVGWRGLRVGSVSIVAQQRTAAALEPAGDALLTAPRSNT